MASQKMLESKNLKNNDLIWGKTENGDWWPGQITIEAQKPKKKLFQVDFFGYPPSQSFLPLSKITKYQNEQTLFQKGRLDPSLKRAIHEAKLFYKVVQESKNQLHGKKERKQSSLENLPEEKTELVEPEQKTAKVAPQKKEKVEKQKSSVRHNQLMEAIRKSKKIKKQKKIQRSKSVISEISEGNISAAESTLGKSQYKLLVKKLYNLLKKKFGKEKSRKLAIQLIERRKEAEPWKNILTSCTKQWERTKRSTIPPCARILRRRKK